MIRNVFVGALFAGVVALVACSSDEEDKYPNADAFCAALADEECKALAASCAASQESCVAKRKPACDTATTAAVAEGRTFQPDAVQGCLDKTRDVYSARTIDAAKDADREDSCARVFAGSKTKSQGCTTTYQCEGQLICDKSYCGDKVEKGLDEPCNDPGAVCATGTYCAARDDGGSKFCTKRRALGEACNDATAPCDETLRCAGTCVAKNGPGQPCDVDSDCSASTPYCDPATRKCQVEFQAGTQACKDFGG